MLGLTEAMLFLVLGWTQHCTASVTGRGSWLQVISGYRKASALLKDMTVKDPHGVWNSLFLEVTAACMGSLPIH